MHNKERLGHALAMAGQADRIMTYDVLDNNAVLKAYGGYKDDRLYNFDEIVAMNARALRGVGLDMSRSIHDPANLWMRNKVANWIRFFRVDPQGWKVEQTGETAWIAERPFHDLAGLRKNLPQIPDVDEIKAWYGPFVRNVTTLFEKEDRIFVGAAGGPICDAYTYTDMEFFAMLLYDAPELVEHLLECTSAYTRAVASAYMASGTAPLFLMGEDIAGSNGPIFSPTMITTLGVERWKRIAEPIRTGDGRFIFHSDGRYGALLELILGSAGLHAEGLNPIERTGCNDIFALHEAWPDTFLFGNVCCEETLPFGNRYDVEDETLELIEKLGPSRRMFIGSSSEVHNAVPLLNIEVMYATVHEYGGYPIDIDRIRRRRRAIAALLGLRRNC